MVKKTYTLNDLTAEDLEILEFGIVAWLITAHRKLEFGPRPYDSQIVRGENLQKRLKSLLDKCHRARTRKGDRNAKSQSS